MGQELTNASEGASDLAGTALPRHLARLAGREAAADIFCFVAEEEELEKCQPAAVLDPLFNDAVPLVRLNPDAKYALREALAWVIADILDAHDKGMRGDLRVLGLLCCLVLRELIHDDPVDEKRKALAGLFQACSGLDEEALRLGLGFLNWLQENDEERDFQVHYDIVRFLLCAKLMQVVGPRIAPRFKYENDRRRNEWILGELDQHFPIWQTLWRSTFVAGAQTIPQIIAEVEAGTGLNRLPEAS